MRMVISRPRAPLACNRPENLRGYFSGEAAGVPLADGRHQIGVEDIGVEMHPELLDTQAGDRG